MSTELKTLNGYGFDATKLGGLDAQYYAQGRAAHNLLDNSDFRNPVNQRGIQSGASITEYTYCLDRWMNFGATAGTLTLSENGISFTITNLNQILPETIKTGTVVTAAAKWNDGTVVTVTGAITRGNAWTWFTAANNGHQIGVIDMGNNKEAHFTILGGSGVVEWAALYEGSYTADTLPAYVPKGYAAELAECQRYYYAVENELLFSALADINGCLDYTVLLPQTMRAIPTVTFDKLQYADESGYVSFTNSPYYTGRDRVAIRKVSGLTPNKAYGLIMKFSASADL